ncbi:hypothetical protein FRC11_003310, partial [Ceratobasidium sp. 423]
GVTPGHAHLDTPPPGAEVVPLERSQRARKETRLGELWRQELCPKSARKVQSHPIPSSQPQQSDASMPSHAVPTPSVLPTNSSSSPSTVASNSMSATQAAPTPTKTMHPLSKTTIGGFERGEFVKQVGQLIGQDCLSLSTQELESMLEVIQNCQEASHAPEERQTPGQTIVHALETLNVGGGFHLVTRSDFPESPLVGLKRTNAHPSQASSKRARVTEQGENTDTEDEDSSQPPPPPSNSVPLQFASPHVSRPSSGVLGRPTSSTDRSSASALANSGSDRPVGLPRSAATATVGTQPPGLPCSSRDTSAEVPVTTVPSSVSPSPAPARPISVSSATPASSSQASMPPGNALSSEHINALLNFALDLTKKQVSDAPSHAQGPLNNAVNATYLRAHRGLWSCSRGAPQQLERRERPPMAGERPWSDQSVPRY